MIQTNVVNEELLAAAKAGDVGAIRAALALGPKYLGPEDVNRALNYAAAQGHVLAVNYLLDQGADIHFQPWYIISGIKVGTGDALSEASEGGHIEVVRVLLERGADPRNCWALDVAAEEGHMPIVELLLQAGADASADNYWAIQSALDSGQLAVSRYLLKIEHAKNGPKRALNVFCRKQLKKCVVDNYLKGIKAILDSGADVRRGRQTVLRLAARRNNRNIALLLIKRGANPREALKWEKTPRRRAFLEKLLADQEVQSLVVARKPRP
jgi:ankyrin repeat protein